MTGNAPKPGDKQRYIRWLVLIVAALMPAIAWLALLAAEHDKRLGNWGSPAEIAATLLVVSLVLALIVVAITLGRVLEYVDPEQMDFPPLSASFRNLQGQLAAYLERQPPRTFEAACFAPIWNGLFPPAARWSMALMLPLIVAMFFLLGYILIEATEVDRILDEGPIATTTATITAVEKRHDRNNGRHVALTYRFMPIDGTRYLQSRSFTDQTDLQFEDRVSVEYIPRDPSMSRLSSMRTTPVDPTKTLIPVGGISLIILPGFGLYLWSRRRFARTLLTEGWLVDATIESVRRGGRGMVFCKVVYRIHGLSKRKRLVTPADPSLYATLHNRHQHGQTIKVLAHPERFGSVYLIEPHLSQR